MHVGTDAVTVTNEIQIIASAKSVKPAREDTTTTSNNSPTRIKKKIVPTATATAPVTMMMSSTKTTPAKTDTQHNNPSSTQSNSGYVNHERNATKVEVEVEKPNENVPNSSMVEGAKVYIRDPH